MCILIKLLDMIYNNVIQGILFSVVLFFFNSLKHLIKQKWQG